ncbi:MAG: SpoIIE family protein phosphatase [Chlorobi bacterium]|nr:SpoIIE family protein phosphatase [Chlorobiota bacterium]
MKRLLPILILFLTLTFVPVRLAGQTFEFKIYNTSSGLPDNFIYSLTQGANGFIWIGTSEGLARYDGHEFVTFTVADSLAENFIQSLYVDSKGVLWIGHNEGHLSYMKNFKFHKILIPDVQQPVNDICEDSDGNIWFVNQKAGLFRLDKNNKPVHIDFNWKSKGRRIRFYSLASISPREFLVGTIRGLFLVLLDENDKIVTVKQIEDIPGTRINRIVKRKGNSNEFWIATDDEGFFKYSYFGDNAKHIINNDLCSNFNFSKETILDISEESSGNLLLATMGSGVIKLMYDQSSDQFTQSFSFNTSNGLKENNIKKILCDREGNYWFGSFTEGIFALVQDYFIFYNLKEIGFEDNKAYSVYRSGQILWIGLKDGLLKVDPYCFSNYEYYDSEFGLPNDIIRAYYRQDNGVLWVATARSGLFYKKPGELRFRPYYYTSSLLKKQITDMKGDGSILYLGTMDSFIILDTRKKTKRVFSTNDGLLHNTINFVFKDNKNNLWIGTKNSGITKIDSTWGIERFKIDSRKPINISDMTQDKDGNFWLSSTTDGIYKYMPSLDSIVRFTTRDGLKKNFAYHIICDYKNKIWVCHHPGLTSIDVNDMEFRTYGANYNMDYEFYHVEKDSNETLWFATEKGVIHYFPDRDVKNNMPPLLNFTSITVDDKKIDFTKHFTLPYPYRRPNYNIKFAFSGISFKDPDGITYEYLLDDKSIDEDNDKWRNIGNTKFKEFERISAGDYEFKIRAFNSDGIPTINPISVSFTIELPFWQKWWFIVFVIIILGLAIFFLIRHREKRLKHQKELLEKEVASQTIKLREQNEEIERKNRDITDSINYAKKIQSSILPSKSLLQELMPQSFVFFKPRDIVSGDFYWFNRSGDHFVVCCADCTGHGVPGAFMSMIGTTMLNDIFKIPTVKSPADMLERLDMEIKILLQSNNDSDIDSKDGMDISIVEIHLPTNRVRLASAKRPVYLYINDELSVYKGNRRSIGDSLTYDNSPFINIEYQCNKGDSIYLFTDGYSDQFGGPRGKKFMTAGVKNLVSQIHNLPINEQYRIVEETFNNWKGNEAQVDDVLFMGLKF